MRGKDTQRMERTRGASTSLCVRAKTDKFQFAQTICRWRSAGLQSRPHIHVFDLQTTRRTCVYEALQFMENIMANFSLLKK